MSKITDFTGLREILSVSGRSLGDVNSGIKDISAVCGGVDGLLLERLVETNLKILGLINGFCTKKLNRMGNDMEAVGRRAEEKMRLGVPMGQHGGGGGGGGLDDDGMDPSMGLSRIDIPGFGSEGVVV